MNYAFTAGTIFNATLMVGGHLAIKQFNFRGIWEPSTAYTAADVVIAADAYGVVQTWVSTSNFTSGGDFHAGSQWVGALAAQQIFYIVGVERGNN